MGFANNVMLCFKCNNKTFSNHHQIFDMMGCLVKTQTEQSEDVILSLEEMPQGVYSIRAKLKNGKLQTEKLIAR